MKRQPGGRTRSLRNHFVRFAPVLVALFWVGTAQAQGVELTFGVGFRAESDSNPGLVPDSPGFVTQVGADLTFGLLSETRSASLALGASGKVVASTGPGNPASGLVDPSFTLAYVRTAATAEFTIDASIEDTDVATDAGVDDFTTGTGTQRTAKLAVGLTWGQNGPLGFGLTADASSVNYSAESSPDLIDSRTLALGTQARADLSPVLHFDIAATKSRFMPEDRADRDTMSLLAGLTLDRPVGNFGVALGIDKTPDGRRSKLTFSREITLPAATLSYRFGATRSVTGQVYATGALNYAQDFPDSSFSFGLERTVEASLETDSEIIESSASLNYSREITPRANIVLTIDWAEQKTTGTNLSIANTNLSAVWTQEITPDWSLDLGYSHRLRQDDTVGNGQSDAVFVEVRRAFTFRP